MVGGYLVERASPLWPGHRDAAARTVAGVRPARPGDVGAVLRGPAGHAAVPSSAGRSSTLVQPSSRASNRW
jgi:hypothetical protein